MANMFNKNTEIGGAFRANEMVLSFAGFGAGYLITSVNAGYQISVTRLRELGSNRVYFIEGDSGGTMQLGQVVGPANSIVPLVRAYSDVCGIARNVIRLHYASGSCEIGGSSPDLSLSGAVITGYSIQSQSQGAMTTTANMSGMFESMDADSDTGGGLAGALNAAGNLAAAAGL